MRQKEVPGRYCRSNICRGFRHLQSYPCQGAANFAREEFSLTEAADYTHVSPQHLSRVFRKSTGITFMDYITRVRIRRAIELLRDDDHKMYEIAEAVGYSSQHYFSSAFKKVLGVSPMEYKKSLQKRGEPNP